MPSVFREPASGYLLSLTEVMRRMTVYTTDPCGYCRTAKALLAKRRIPYEEINLARDPEGRAELVRLTGMMTFPQVVIDGEPLGGYQELVKADRDGQLAELAEAAAWPAAAAGSSRTRRSPAPPPAACRTGRPQRTHGSPSRRWIRKRSWNEPLTPSGSRKSSIVAPLDSIPSSSVSTTASRSARRLLAVDAVRAPQRVDAGAEQRLVGVDVADAGDPLLVEQHRLDRRAAAAGERVQVLAGELGLERLDPQALGEEVVERLRAERELAGPEPARVDELAAWPSPRSKVTRVCGGRSGGSSSSVPVMRRCSSR